MRPQLQQYVQENEHCDAPLVTVGMPVWNRADVLDRAVQSVLAQDHRNWELIIVDDGSTDSSADVARAYRADQRVRLIQHPVNRGVCAAINTCLDHGRGEWITLLGSDDEMLPHALSRMLEVAALQNGASIDAVTCSCFDSRTGRFSGTGISESGMLDARTIATRCRGEFWGITKRSLIGELRFNEAIRGGDEDTLWYRVNVKAHRYYVHEALRVYHTEGGDRLSKGRRPLARERETSVFNDYRAIIMQEEAYLAILRELAPERYRAKMQRACAAFLIKRDFALARQAHTELVAIGGGRLGRLALRLGFILGPWWIRTLRAVRRTV